MTSGFSRRDLLTTAGLVVRNGLVGGLTAGTAAAEPVRTKDKPFGFSLNTSTIRGQELGIVREVEIAAQAGYDAIEPWMGTLDDYVKKGGSLKDLGKRIRDLGLTVESAIGFAQWIVDDEAARKSGLEQAQRDMETLIADRRQADRGAAGWCTRQTRPRSGDGCGPLQGPARTRRPDGNYSRGRSVGLLEDDEPTGGDGLRGDRKPPSESVRASGRVPPLQRRLGFRGAEAALGNGGAGVSHQRLSRPSRAAKRSAMRIASIPATAWRRLRRALRDLRLAGFRGFLSLELFNRDYWKQDALAVAKTGLEKMKAVVARSLEGE